MNRKTPRSPRSTVPAFLCSKKSLLLGAMAVLMGASTPGARAQTYTVTTTAASGTGSLVDAIYQANLGNYDEISIQSGLGTISLTSQMLIYADVNILGNGNVINMNSADRAFFIVGGAVNISNLTIENAMAQGGYGGETAGGGAGLGAGIFVAYGPSIQSDLTFPSNVNLTNVTFKNNKAVGGAGGKYSEDARSGGGGMGGNGATGGKGDFDPDGGGGGGGFGNGADGGDGSYGGGDGGAGAFVLPTVSIGGGGHGGYDGGSGGANGGGGGGGSEGVTFNGGGGGGGVNAPDASEGTGSDGGFGGGGGAGTTGRPGTGGKGGFGGGGGVSNNNESGKGGFGGGGAGSVGDYPNSGGFGGGSGGYDPNANGDGGGGGGAGMGGAVFVMKGASLTVTVDSTQAGTMAFTGNTVTGGAAGTGGSTGVPAAKGSAIGSNIFLGENVVFNVAQASSNFEIGGLGGAGDLADPNVAAHATDTNAQGGLIKQGAGTLTLTGQNYYSGQTVINSGKLALAASALEQGTNSVIVGQNNGDVATLALHSSANLSLGTNGTVVLGQAAGSTGTVIIGADGLNGAYFQSTTTFSGGTGGGQVIFNQSLGANGADEYMLWQNFTGNLSIVQNGTGLTILRPLATTGNNTYTGPTIVNDGTLQLSSGSGLGQALPDGGLVQVNGGQFDIAGVTIAPGQLVVSGGTVFDAVGGGSITTQRVTLNSGTVSAVIAGSGDVVQNGAGTTVLSAVNTYTGATAVIAGQLNAAVTNALGAGPVIVMGTGTLELVQGVAQWGITSSIVGVNAGDNATLLLPDQNTYVHADAASPLDIALNAGSNGTVMIGSGGQSSGAYIGVNVFNGGAGNAQVIFNQTYAPQEPGEQVYTFLTTLTGSLKLVQQGAGTTLLDPQYGANTYTGGTLVQNGTLQVEGTGALGTGAVTVSGGMLNNVSGSAISNDVVLSGGQYAAAVNAGGSYAGMADATSSFGNGRATTASLLAGAASTATTLTTSFATTSTALNDDLRLSEVYSFSGTGTDIFVLELSMTSVGAGSYLGWLNTSSNTWVNAVEGNTGNTASAEQQGYAGSFAAFQSVYGTTLTSYLGAYGADTATGTVWAVVNHNSDFSVVPEPSTWALLLAGAGSAIVMALRRRKREGVKA